MKKQYLIFDLDWTLINSMSWLVDLILDNLENHTEMSRDEMRYLFKTSAWTPLEKQMSEIFWCEKKWKEFWKKVYDEILKFNQKNPAQFFEWVPEKIKELSKKYKLFLTTWNHTKFAKEVLEKWWILDCFEKVLWSDEIHKWEQHLKIFKEKVELEFWEKNFFEKSVYIWDWDADREFAWIFDIDFIHIWNEWKDEFEIGSVVEIDNILWKINKKIEFEKWNNLKQNIEFFWNEKNPEICEIWWVNLWENIWFEQSWKRDDFSRPFLVTKKIWNLFFWFPLSSVYKENIFYKKLEDVKYVDKKYYRKNSMVLLSQWKVVDKKRFIKIIWRIKFSELKNIKKMFKDLYL